MRTADKVDRRESAIQAYREWLDKYSWNYFCTLKLTSGPPSKRRAEELFRTWIKELEKAEGGDDFRWFRVTEYGSVRSNPHFHVLVGGFRNRMRQWEDRWATLGGDALVTKFDAEKDGILYMLKMTDNRGDLEFDCKFPSEQLQETQPKTEPTDTRAQNQKQAQLGIPRRIPRRKQFDVCGLGATASGKGSGFAWVCVDTGESHIEWRDGLTKDQSEYCAIISAIRIAGLVWDEDNGITICTDSRTVANQLSVPFPRIDKSLERLFEKAKHIAVKKEIILQPARIPRSENAAAKLLDRWTKSRTTTEMGGNQE